ncbi:Toll/interleukin-1 receptor domain-containing protein [Tanacetum coccineum]
MHLHSWCLDELVQIMGATKRPTIITYNLSFIDVEPSEVRKQSGAVGKAFAKHKKEEVAGKWRQALEEAANLAGWELKNTTHGLFDLSIQYEAPVRMEPRKNEIVSDLGTNAHGVRMIGIKGMGGGGKTTLARAVFDQICFQFEGRSFVENNQRITISSVHEGKNMLKMKLRNRKVLIVLDDVDHKDQLEALAREPNWFKEGSRIIITTRDEQVLVAHGVKWILNVNLLSDKEHFCSLVGLYERLHLRRPKTIPSTIEEMGKNIVRRLHPDEPNKHSRLWIDEEIIVANDLENHPYLTNEGLGNMKRLRVLHVHSRGSDYLSSGWKFDQLEMRGSNITQLWEGRKERFLRSSDLHGCHHLIELHVPIGCLKRLVYLDIGGGLRFGCFEFNKMRKTLELDSGACRNLKDFTNNGGLQHLKKAKYFADLIHKAPTDLGRLESLEELTFLCKHIKHLPDSICMLKHLKSLELEFCYQLQNLPENLGHLECLEKLIMFSTEIRHIPDSICMLKHLKALQLEYCWRLESLPDDLGQLECLEKLHLLSTRLKHLPDSVCTLRHLKSLKLESCLHFEKLPVDLGQLDSLEHLILADCRSLEDVPLVDDLQIPLTFLQTNADCIQCFRCKQVKYKYVDGQLNLWCHYCEKEGYNSSWSQAHTIQLVLKFSLFQYSLQRMRTSVDNEVLEHMMK